MAAPKPAFIDLSNDDDDDQHKKHPRKKRTSLPHDRAQHLVCWICGRGVMRHKKFGLVLGRHTCVLCGNVVSGDKLSYCIHSN